MYVHLVTLDLVYQYTRRSTLRVVDGEMGAYYLHKGISYYKLMTVDGVVY